MRTSGAIRAHSLSRSQPIQPGLTHYLLVSAPYREVDLLCPEKSMGSFISEDSPHILLNEHSSIPPALQISEALPIRKL